MYNFKKRIIYVIALSQQDDCDLIKLNFKGKFNQTNQWQDLFSVTDFFLCTEEKDLVYFSEICQNYRLQITFL